MNKNIVFMGTSEFAVPILKSLYQNGFPISIVYTKPPKKSKRGQKVNKSPIHIFSETLGFEVRTPLSLKNNGQEIEFLKKNKFRFSNCCCLWSNYTKVIFKFN